jgi:hypothetical protein
MKKILFIIFFYQTFVFSQNLTFYGVLPVINQTGRISQKFNYNLFVSTTIDAFKSLQNNTNYPAKDLQLYLQPSIIYLASPSLNFAASYTYQRNNPITPDFTNEHRLWQQMIYSFPVGTGRLTNRFRLEERFIQSKNTAPHTLATRVRYQLGLNMPLQGKTLDEKEFYLNTYNEFYFSLTGTKNATFSENWSYLGIGYNLGKMGRIELGYLSQVYVRNLAKDLRFLEMTQIMWSTNFNFTKKKR